MANTARKPAAVRKNSAKPPKSKESQMNAAAAELIRMAEEGGVEQNYFFTTTFERYKMQLNMLERLRKEIDAGELLIQKEYVRGRECTVANPAINEYNKTSQSANQTVSILIKIIKTFAAGPVLGSRKSEEDEDIDL
jgi:hypothetical protein